ncbi:hypothetical protein [Serratia rhizosphaerae]|uniref:Uncharacterized protein n=1 Tax=Serratia rhizosphaerae TaxID=2597702 RepID=A0ABX6GTJ0_9GAMM|nr:hypothetical protein [Serratia rhizosphaerae]MEB6336834.1 hypothetical protein [Serratia rhizosphaerae]QHA89609.1 hypothetical protein FO014_22925 [Serratia rhizosphaerae]
MIRIALILLLALIIGILLSLGTLWYLQHFTDTQADGLITLILLLGIAYGSLVIATHLVHRWRC